MKTLVVTAYVTASVVEEWTFQVPDDYIPPQVDDVDINDLADQFPDFWVVNTHVSDERDRDIVEVELADQDHRWWAAGSN